MLIYSLISLLRHLGGFGTSLQVGCGVGGSPPRDLCQSVLPRGNDVLHQPKGNGRGLLNAVRSNRSSRRRLMTREKVEMLFGHLKGISDWTNCACVAKRCGKQTDRRTHRQSSPHEARRVKLRLAGKGRGRTLPPPSAGFFSATHWARPFEVMAPQATPLAHDPPAFCDELSSPTRSELPPMNADPPGGPATKLRRTLENQIPRVRTAASNATRCHRARRFTMMGRASAASS